MFFLIYDQIFNFRLNINLPHLRTDTEKKNDAKMLQWWYKNDAQGMYNGSIKGERKWKLLRWQDIMSIQKKKFWWLTSIL